jgi:hypothetical protein
MKSGQVQRGAPKIGTPKERDFPSPRHFFPFYSSKDFINSLMADT